ncbi:MAG: DNA translocase FtsK 4TM domain-containing protein [Rhodospirillaceae bacterium]|nr:DNA translocase FtsK 4TM domain-containing protein [Rhodospirillaceae bacterium]
MTTASRTQNVPFLPPAWEAMLKRTAWTMSGLGVFILLGLGAAALLTYTPTDPSLNTASNALVQNALGKPGAVVADLLLQIAGLGIAAVFFAVTSWAVCLVKGEAVEWLWLRTLSALGACILIATALAAVPAPGIWPIDAGLGGSVGHVVLSLTTFKTTIPFLMQSQHLLIAAAAGVLGLWLMFLSATVSFATTMSGLAALMRGLGAGLGAFNNVWRGWLSREPVEVDAKPKRAKRERAEPAMERGRIEPVIGAGPASKTDEDDDADTALVIDDEMDEDDGAPIFEDAPKSKASVVVQPVKPAKQVRRDMAARQGSLLPASNKGFSLPPLDFLALPLVESRNKGPSTEALESNARMLETVLEDFGVKGQIVKVRPGPVVTLYELEPAPGTKTSRVVALADDIARSMSAVAVRIAVVPGRSVIGIELPNAHRETVYFREMLATEEFEKSDGKLVLALGKDIGGAPIMADLARMPHLLIAGTTGSGKSVAVNTMIMSLLYRNTPADVRFIMIDPKMLELSVYDGIPHLLAPVVTEPGKAVMALKWVVREMENRYRAMSQLSVRNVAGYNQRLQDAAKKGQVIKKTVQTGFDPATGKPIYEEQDLDLTPLPYIVVIIDEMADLMLVAGKDVEAAVQRLAQMARAAGIHVIMATQRPSVDVITGTIKANFPTRISFQVTSKIDSRTILGEQGAEQLLGQGDMLYMAAGGRITRVHGPFVTDKEVEKITGHLRDQAEPEYLDDVTEEPDLSDVPGFAGLNAGGNTTGEDTLFDQAVAVVARERKASTSFIQRHLQIGYNRAARIIEEMEAQGMVGKPNHVGKREVLLPEHAAR